MGLFWCYLGSGISRGGERQKAARDVPCLENLNFIGDETPVPSDDTSKARSDTIGISLENSIIALRQHNWLELRRGRAVHEVASARYLLDGWLRGSKSHRFGTTHPH